MALPTLWCENTFTVNIFTMQTNVENPGEGKDVVKQVNAADVKRNIENHRQAASHHQEAAQHHLEAAKYHEAGDHGKAHESAHLAYGHLVIAGEFLSDDAKHHAQSLKQTNYHH